MSTNPTDRVTTSGLIPDQPLRDRRNRPMPFLYWVTAQEVGKVASFIPATFFQLIHTFHAVCANYGLKLEPQHHHKADFVQACLQSAGILVRAPKLFLMSRENPDQYACFDWAVWMQCAADEGAYHEPKPTPTPP